MKLIAMVLLVACGPTETRAPGDAGGGMPGDGGAQTSNVDCTSTFEHTETKADGTRIKSTSRYALVADVGPENSFTLETCRSRVIVTPPIPPSGSCPEGSTCTDVGVPPPAGADSCFVTRDGGQFFEGKLVVFCGAKSERFDANGTLVQTVESGPETIRLTK